jgi:hypothetical protein
MRAASIRRDHEDDGIGGLDQTAKPHLPVFSSGNVVLVEVGLEAHQL